MTRGRLRAAALAAVSLLATGSRANAAMGGGPPARTEPFSLRGVSQTLHLYGAPGGKVAIVTSGDGGWVHLGPDVAEFLAGEGYRVVGFDAKAYLSFFTSRSGPLHVEDVPRDYGALLDYAAKDATSRPLVGGCLGGSGALRPCRHCARGPVARRGRRGPRAAGPERAGLALARLDHLRHEEDAGRADSSAPARWRPASRRCRSRPSTRPTTSSWPCRRSRASWRTPGSPSSSGSSRRRTTVSATISLSSSAA